MRAPAAAISIPSATIAGQYDDAGRWIEAWGSATLAAGAPPAAARRGPCFSRQKESRPYTGGIASKSCAGGGDEVRHSSVRPSQGSAGAGAPRERLRQAFTMKISTATPMPNAPIVEAKLAAFHPRSGR